MYICLLLGSHYFPVTAIYLVPCVIYILPTNSIILKTHVLVNKCSWKSIRAGLHPFSASQSWMIFRVETTLGFIKISAPTLGALNYTKVDVQMPYSQCPQFFFRASYQHFCNSCHKDNGFIWEEESLMQSYPFVFSGPARNAQCAKTPREPDRRSPCPPHLLLLPSWLHTSTTK